MIPTPRFVRVVTLAACVCFAVPARADVELTVALPDFNDAEQPAMYTSGRAAPHRGGIQLTDTVGTQAGAAYFRTPLTMSSHRSFSAYFSFNMTNPRCSQSGQDGADGLAFVIQPDLDATGKSGGGLGYRGIPASVAIEFDSFYNSENKDPEKDHVGINVDGAVESLARAEVPFKLNDGRTYHAWIDYDGKDDTMQVRLSLTNARPTEPVLAHKVDLEKHLRTEQFVGFTASTGTCSEQHQVHSLYFNADNLVGGIDTSIEHYVMTTR
jgi:hypothetical protein